MTKSEFLSALENRLSGLPKDDVQKSIDYYSEIIDDRMEEGITEEEAVAAVGSVEEIASQILKDTPLVKLVKEKVRPSRTLKAWEIILLILGSPVWLPLLLTVVILILTAYVVLWVVILSLYAVDLCVAAGAAAGIIGSFLWIPAGNMVQFAFVLGLGLVCAGGTVLLFFGFNQITKGICRLSKWILLRLKSCFVRKGEAQ